MVDRAVFRFAMPKPVRITGRSSSITNSFVNGIIPVVPPTVEQIDEARRILGMEDEVVCAYCGDTASEWDHLRPLVIGKQPTGYISEIHNLVPACGKCNQSKGNKPWRLWMFSSARLSPETRGIVDLEQRANRLAAYEERESPTHTRRHRDGHQLDIGAGDRSAVIVCDRQLRAAWSWVRNGARWTVMIVSYR